MMLYSHNKISPRSILFSIIYLLTIPYCLQASLGRRPVRKIGTNLDPKSFEPKNIPNIIHAIQQEILKKPGVFHETTAQTMNAPRSKLARYHS